MIPAVCRYLLLCLLLLSPLGVCAGEAPEKRESRFITVWPLLDYRETAAADQSSLSILGPLFRWQRRGDEVETTLRPFFSHLSHAASGSSETTILYPVASSDSSPQSSHVQALQLFRHATEAAEGDRPARESSMLFPFYISGTSEKYGPYRSVFPIYGDLYERFWRDEHHYVLFPLYSRTVKAGTTSTNILYPFFSYLSGEDEKGFQVWPLYGQAAREGAYRRRFLLWPIFSWGERELDTDHPAEHLTVFPLYASVTSSVLSERHVLWPFFGHRQDLGKKQETWDILWPLWVVSRGEQRTVTRFLPFYASEQGKTSGKQWYLWPLYRHDDMKTPTFEQDRHRLLYFLYSDNRETLPEFGIERRKRAFWPLFLYRGETGGFSRLTMPALLEPIIDREGIERSWAPLWRLYQQTWNDRGDGALSIFWNLYWQERSGNDLAWELFPLISYQREGGHLDVRVLKGLFSFDERQGKRSLSLFWLPAPFAWQADVPGADARTK